MLKILVLFLLNFIQISNQCNLPIQNNINKFRPKFDSKKPPPLEWVKKADCTDFVKQYNKWGSLPGDDEKEETAEAHRLRENGETFILFN